MILSSSAYLIIGCGFLGNRLRALLPVEQCWFTRRPTSTIDHSDDTHCITLDINTPDSWRNLERLNQDNVFNVILMVPPSQIDVSVFADFVKRINSLPLRRCILVSSTVVYGTRERRVDADSDVEIDNKRAKRQYNIEQLWQAGIDHGCVVRLAGLYGPDRIIGHKSIMNNETLSSGPEGWLNLIHVDDAAALLLRICELEKVNRVELGCDGTPVIRKEYYTYLADVLGQTHPVFTTGQAGPKGRRCDNTLTISRTGWQPKYGDYKMGLQHLI